MIQLKDVTVSLRDHIVFQNLSCRFESGISYLLEGYNGAGKTTLLNMLGGKIHPREGYIQYEFMDDTLSWDEKYELRKRNIHYVPTHALHELISTRELFYQQRYYTIEESTSPNLVRDYLGERLQNLTKLQLPESFQVNYLLNIELSRLSNGQIKKVILLKQLLDTIPKVLLLDYPFEGLDVQSREELSEFLDHLAAAHRIQLIIADNEHPHLPQAVTKRMMLHKSGIGLADRLKNSQTLVAKLVTSMPMQKETAPTVVEMCDVRIQYGEKVIIDKLNWKILQGERWALTGRNGSGKTTLFSMIYADHPMAYREKVFLFGKRRGTGESIWDIKKRISYLGPEQLHFIDHITEQLNVSEYLKKAQPSQEKLNQLMVHFQIESLLSKQLRQLSNGELQLILLFALFLAPKELLLLDEPFQFLDLQQKERVTKYIDSCLEESTTLVLITHYEDDVIRWTNHRLCL